MSDTPTQTCEKFSTSTALPSPIVVLLVRACGAGHAREEYNVAGCQDLLLWKLSERSSWSGPPA